MHIELTTPPFAEVIAKELRDLSTRLQAAYVAEVSGRARMSDEEPRGWTPSPKARQESPLGCGFFGGHTGAAYSPAASAEHLSPPPSPLAPVRAPTLVAPPPPPGAHAQTMVVAMSGALRGGPEANSARPPMKRLPTDTDEGPSQDDLQLWLSEAQDDSSSPIAFGMAQLAPESCARGEGSTLTGSLAAGTAAIARSKDRQRRPSNVSIVSSALELGTTSMGFGRRSRTSRFVASWQESDFAWAVGEATNDRKQGVGDTIREKGYFQRFVNLPGSRCRIVWDVVGVLFVGYDGFMIPFTQAFHRDEIGATIAALMVLSTLFWTLDIPMSFIVGYHSGGLIEMRLSHIARRYMRTWLVPDVIIVCLDWLFIILGITQESSSASTDNTTGLARVARTVRVFRMLRIVRLLRLPKLFRKVRELYARIRNEFMRVLFQMWGTFAVMMILTHFVACGWYSVGSCLWGDIQICDSGSRSWPKVFLPEEHDMLYAYTTSLHWAAGQFSVAGTNDIAPQKSEERLYSTLVVWRGLMVFSVYVSSITANMTQLRTINAEHFAEEEAIKLYMSEHKVSVELGRCIMDFFYKQRREERMRAHEADIEVLNFIPERLRMQLRIEVFMPSLIVHPFFRFFKEIDILRISRLCNNSMKEIRFREVQELFRPNDKAKGMYLLRHGSVAYSTSSEVHRLSESNWISEAALWVGGWQHRGKLVASSKGEVILLSSDTFQRFLHSDADDPSIQQAIQRFMSAYSTGFLQCNCESELLAFRQTDLWGSKAEISQIASIAYEASLERGNKARRSSLKFPARA